MDLVTDRVLESIVTSWQTREKSHRVHEHSVSNNFCKTTVFKKENNNKTLKLRSTVFYWQIFGAAPARLNFPGLFVIFPEKFWSAKAVLAQIRPLHFVAKVHYLVT